MPGVHVITGGLGGLGLRTAALLADRDASVVVLSSRSGRVPRGGLDASLCARATVRVSSSDVGDAMDSLPLLGGLAAAGVLHAAGVLCDMMLRAMGSEALGTAFAPKALAASTVHACTAPTPMDAFGLFSSASAT